MSIRGFSSGWGKESCNAEDPVSIPGSGRPPGEGNYYSLQHSCLEMLWIEESGGLQLQLYGGRKESRLSD